MAVVPVFRDAETSNGTAFCAYILGSSGALGKLTVPCAARVVAALTGLCWVPPKLGFMLPCSGGDEAELRFDTLELSVDLEAAGLLRTTGLGPAGGGAGKGSGRLKLLLLSAD